MSKKESHTTEVSQAELEILEAMRTAPGLTPQITAMLKAFEAETEQGMDAYQAELHAVELTRKLGGLLLEQWGEQTQEEQSRQSSLDPNLIKHGKKKLYWQSTFGPIDIEQQVFKNKLTGVTNRPFLDYAKLSASGCSLLLKRRLVDFSSERSMEDCAKALKEHYGVKLSSSVINKVTQEAGRAAKEFNVDAPSSKESAPLLVVEIDGSMVPIVEYGEASEEQKQAGKKHDRSCFWKEFRLCTVSLPGKVGTRYGVTDGPPFEAGCMMYQICQYEGMDGDTQIHGVADGAPWIAEQFDEQFGANHKFYIDFYHTSEYLGDASKELTANHLVGADWYEQQRQRLRKSKASEVLSDLAQKNDQHLDQEAVESCLRYLGNRLEYLDYATALEQNLPIGSGEVESGHRSVLQKRLKKPGAWWLKENAETMAQLKVVQSNGHWDDLWQKIAA